MSALTKKQIVAGALQDAESCVLRGMLYKTGEELPEDGENFYTLSALHSQETGENYQDIEAIIFSELLKKYPQYA